MKKIIMAAVLAVGVCSVSQAATHQRITDDITITTHDNGTTTTHQRIADDITINTNSQGGSSSTHRISDDIAITTQSTPFARPAATEPSIFDSPSKKKNKSMFDLMGDDE